MVDQLLSQLRLVTVEKGADIFLQGLAVERKTSTVITSNTAVWVSNAGRAPPILGHG